MRRNRLRWMLPLMGGGASAPEPNTLDNAEGYWLVSDFDGTKIPNKITGGVDLTLAGGTSDPIYINHVYDGYYLPGVTSSYIRTAPSDGIKGITGDVEIIWAGRRASWTSSILTPIGRFPTSVVDSRTFRLYFSNGTVRFNWYDSSNTLKVVASTTAINWTAWAYGAVRFTFDCDNESGGHTGKFYTSTDYNPVTGTGTWTQLGDDVVGTGTTDIRTIASDGAYLVVNGEVVSESIVCRALVYNGIGGTLVADFDASQTMAADGRITSGGDIYYITTPYSTTPTEYRYGTGKLPAFVDRDCMIFDGVVDYLVAIGDTFADKHWVVACQQVGDVAIKFINATPGVASGSDFHIGYDATRKDFGNMQLVGLAVFAKRPTGANLIALSTEMLGVDLAAPYFERYASNPLLESGVNLSLTTCLNFSVIKASEHIATPLNTYYGYMSTEHDSGAGGIYLFTAPAPTGPWTEYEPEGSAGPIYQDTVVGHQTETPVVFWDAANSRYLMIYHNNDAPSDGLQSSVVASSTDGLTWTRIGYTQEATAEYPHTGYWARPIDDDGTLYAGHMLKGGALTQIHGMSHSSDGVTWVLDGVVSHTAVAVDDFIHLARCAHIKYGGKFYTLTQDRDINETTRSRAVAVRHAANHVDFASHPTTIFPMNAAWEDTATVEIFGSYCEGGVAYIYYSIDRRIIGVAIGVCDE